MAIGKWYIDAEVNMSSVKKETRKVQKELKKSGAIIENDLGKKGNKAVSGLTSSFARLGGLLAGVFSVGAIILFTKKLFQLGSDATEIGSKFDTVFGGIEKTTGQAFDNIAQAVGRSKLELRKFGSDLGDVLKPLGFTTKEASNLSIGMTQLAIDVASFNNVQDEQVINAFKSALTGEREALKSLGIVISEADVKQEAYTSGIAKQGTALTKQQKTLATYSLLFKNSTDAQGDAIRTSKSFANQLKRLQGVMTDTFAEAGKEVAQSTGSWLGDIAKFVQKYGVATIISFIEIIKAIGYALSPIVDVFADVFGGIGEILGTGKEEAFSWGEFFMKVLKGIVFGIQTIGFIFKSTLLVVKALILSAAYYIIDNTKVIISAFKLVGIAISDVFLAVPKLISKGIAKGLNLAVGKLNKFIKWINDTVGTSFKKIDITFEGSKGGLFDSTVGEFKKLKGNLGNLTKNQKKVYGDLKNNLKSGFNDFVLKMDASNTKMSKSIKTASQLEKEAEDERKKREEERKKGVKEMMDKYSKLGNTVNKSNTKQQKSTEDTTNKLKELKDEYSKVEKKIKELDKVSEDYSKNYKKYNNNIIEDVRKLNKELDDRKAKLKEEIKGIELESKNKLAERYVEIKNKELEIQKEIQKVSEGNKNDLNKVKQIQSEINILKQKQKEFTDKTKQSAKDSINLQIQKKEEKIKELGVDNESVQLQIELNKLKKESQSIETNVDKGTLNEAQRKAGLNETERILEEEKLKKEQAQKDFEREKEKLDSLLKINQAFFNLKKLDQQQLNEFQKAETFKNWSTEEQELFLKLAREKVSLTEQANYKLELEKQIQNEIINLSNDSLQAQLNNNTKLSKSYDEIIAKINKAIIRQRKLNQTKGGSGFKDGGFTGYSNGGFTGSGDSNKVAGVVHAGEWVAPAWMLDNLGPMFDKLETMRSSGNISKTINKTQNNNITVNSQFEAENFLDYANWKL